MLPFQFHGFSQLNRTRTRITDILTDVGGKDRSERRLSHQNDFMCKSPNSTCKTGWFPHFKHDLIRRFRPFNNDSNTAQAPSFQTNSTGLKFLQEWNLGLASAPRQMYEVSPDYVNLLPAPTDGFLCELSLGWILGDV